MRQGALSFNHVDAGGVHKRLVIYKEWKHTDPTEQQIFLIIFHLEVFREALFSHERSSNVAVTSRRNMISKERLLRRLVNGSLEKVIYEKGEYPFGVTILSEIDRFTFFKSSWNDAMRSGIFSGSSQSLAPYMAAICVQRETRSWWRLQVFGVVPKYK